jgi:hypothetical protein
MRRNEMLSSLPNARRSANPAAAGGSAQLPVRNDNATPASAAILDTLPRGVAISGRGLESDDPKTALVPSSGREVWAARFS